MIDCMHLVDCVDWSIVCSDEKTYNNMVKIFKSSSTLATFREGFGEDISSGSHHLTSNPKFVIGVGQQKDGVKGVDLRDVDVPVSARREYFSSDASGSDVDPIETNVYSEWGGKERKWSRYLKTYKKDGKLSAKAIDESEAPDSIKYLEYTETLKGRANYQAHDQQKLGAPADYNYKCWTCTDSAQCEAEPRQITLESGDIHVELKANM